MMRSRIAKPIALAALCVTATAFGQSWEEYPHASRFELSAAFFAPDLDTTLVVTDPDQNVGTGIGFERNLGLDDSKSVPLVGASWRFAERHKLDYRYFKLDRSASIQDSSATIVIGDESFDVTLPIQSYFDIQAHEIAYSYSLLFDEKVDLSLGIGLSLQDLELGIQGTEGSPNPGETLSTTLASTAPLPTLNLGFDYAFSDQWIFESTLGWLAVELDLGADEDLSGQIINANAGIRWNPFEHWGFFARYQVFDVDVEYVDRDVRFAVEYDYRGPLLGVALSF